MIAQGDAIPAVKRVKRNFPQFLLCKADEN